MRPFYFIFLSDAVKIGSLLHTFITRCISLENSFEVCPLIRVPHKDCIAHRGLLDQANHHRQLLPPPISRYLYIAKGLLVLGQAVRTVVQRLHTRVRVLLVQHVISGAVRVSVLATWGRRAAVLSFALQKARALVQAVLTHRVTVLLRHQGGVVVWIGDSSR